MKRYFGAVGRPLYRSTQISPAWDLVRPIPKARSIGGYGADIPAFTIPARERNIFSAWRPPGERCIYSGRKVSNCPAIKRPDSEYLPFSLNGGIDNLSTRRIKTCLSRRFITANYGCDRTGFAIKNPDAQPTLGQTMK